MVSYSTQSQNVEQGFCVKGLTLLCSHSFLPVPNCTRNGFDGVIQRSLHSAFEDRVCLIATVRLAKPQFIKVRIFNCFSFYLVDTHSVSCFRALKVALIRTGLSSNGHLRKNDLGPCHLSCVVPSCLCWE